MRVLCLTNVPSPYRVDFFNELGKSADLTVLYERRSAADRDINWKGNEHKNYRAIFLRGLRIGNDASLGFDCIKHLKQRDYDILGILGYSSPTSMLAITYCRANHIPYFISSDGALMKQESSLKKRVKSYLIGGASAWLCTGSSVVDYLKLYGAEEERTYIYPFTSLHTQDILESPLSVAEKSRVRHKLGIMEPQMVLSVGRFIQTKGFDVLLRAGSTLSGNAGIYIIGGEPTEEYLSLKHELGLDNVHFGGFKSKEELKEYYMAADIFVLPTREDVWGLVINEAMACGLPVVTTDRCVAGLELIEDGIHGFIIPTEDASTLSARIGEILSDVELQKTMSGSNLTRIRDYTVEAMAARHLEIFERILDSKTDRSEIN